MAERVVTEAEQAIQLAETFGRTPPAWAVEARRAELQESGEPPMTVQEALSLKCSAAFRTVDPGRLAEADRVLKAGSDGKPAADMSPAEMEREARALVEQITALAESRLGYSHERAALYGQSEAQRAREASSGPSAVLTCLREHAHHLRATETAKERRDISEGKYKRR